MVINVLDPASLVIGVGILSFHLAVQKILHSVRFNLSGCLISLRSSRVHHLYFFFQDLACLGIDQAD